MQEPSLNNHRATIVSPTDDADDSSESEIISLEIRLGLRRCAVLELIDEIVERFGGGTTIDDKRLAELEYRQRQSWHLLISYQSNQSTPQEAMMSTRVMAMELGYYTAAGADNVADLARKTGFQKQAVNKCADTIQKKLGLALRPGQRTVESRKKMAHSRNKQTKQKNGN